MMRKLLISGVPVFLAAALIGCGGATSNSPLPSLYAGSWTGTWNSPDLKASSQAMTFTILSDGSLSGSMARTGGSGTVGGVVNGSGHVTATAAFTASGNYVMGGTVTSANGHLVGSLAISYLGREYMATFDLAPGSGGSGSTGSTGG